MPGRKYSVANTKYRYGFNGKENDNDVKGDGNQQDYGMRIYDPRLGRFLSVDPLIDDYPELTPYQFASNSPITFIDLDGEESAFKMPDGSIYVQPPSDHMVVPIPQNVRDNGVYLGPSKDRPGIMDEGTSMLLDNVPIVGTVKGVIEAAVGTDAAGNKLSTGDRILGVIPYFGKARKLVKVVRAAEKVEEANTVVKTVSKSKKAFVSTEKAIIKTKKELNVLRNKAIAGAWKKEKKLIEETGTGSREWTKEELKQLKEKGRVDGYHGHHKKPVKDYPESAGDVDNIKILKSDNPKGGGAKRGSEHYDAHNQ